MSVLQSGVLVDWSVLTPFRWLFLFLVGVAVAVDAALMLSVSRDELGYYYVWPTIIGLFLVLSLLNLLLGSFMFCAIYTASAVGYLRQMRETLPKGGRTVSENLRQRVLD